MTRHVLELPMRRAFAALLITLVLGSTSSTQPVAAQSDGDTPDLAAMALLPADLEAEDFDTDGLSNGLLTTDSEAAGAFLYRLVEDDGDTGREAIEEADPDRAYIVELVLNARVGDPTSGTEEVIVAYIFSFEDEDAAADGFEVVAEGRQSGRVEEAETEAQIGDETIALTGTGRDRYNKSGFDLVEVVFRAGDIVDGVSMQGFRDSIVELEQVEALAEVLAERIEEVLDDGGPGLSNRVVRFEIPGENSIWDSYSVLDGEALFQYVESEESFEDRQSQVADLDIVDAYRFEQQVLGDTYDANPDERAYVATSLFTFTDDDAASDYLDASIDELQSLDLDDFEMIEDPTEFGDETAVVSYTGGDLTFVRFYIQVDNMVVRVIPASNQGVDVETLEVIVELQVECLDDPDSCSEPQPIPDGIE